MLELNNVSVGYNGQAVLTDINMNFVAGRLTAVIGKNGCGKSTLLKSAAGQLPLLSGSMQIDGRSGSLFSEKEFARTVSYLPQVRNVPNIACGALVAHGRFPYLGFPRVLSGADRERVESAMERMRVADFRDTPLSKLSGGERQRVYLAMQLCQDADVLLLDEPTTYLDLHDGYRVLEMLRRAGSNKAVVTVLHDLGAALTYADYVYLLHEGGVVFSGSSPELYESGEIQRVYRVQSEAVTENGRKHYLFYLPE